MQLPPPPSTLGQRTRPQVITLELVPGQALGAFSLGMSLWSALNYLRANAEAYPSVRIVSSRPSAPTTKHEHEHTPTANPIVLSLGRHIHLAFDPVGQRLQSIVVQSILTSATPRRVSAPASGGQTDPPEGQEQDQDREQDQEFDPWYADPNVSQTWYRHLIVTYRGRALFATSPPHTGVPVLTRSAVHQTLGPTYPGRNFPDHDPWSYILSYPGVAFGFPAQPKHTLQGEDQGQGQGHGHVGEQEETVSTIYLFDRGMRHPFPAPGAGESPPICAPLGETEPVWVQDAEIFPGQGVRLVLASHRHHHHDVQLDEVDLVLGQTEVQDVLADLGTPEARAWKEDERLAIHRVDGAGCGTRAGTPETPPSENDTDQGQAFFFNYFSLGFDLLFTPSAEGVVLSKIICHSNTPGHALFGRYKRLPWRLMGCSSAALTPYRTVLESLRARAREARPDSAPSEAVDGTDRSRSPSAPVAGSGPASDPSETMIVDRASDWYEFKGRLKMDVGSVLRPLRVPVLDVPGTHTADTADAVDAADTADTADTEDAVDPVEEEQEGEPKRKRGQRQRPDREQCGPVRAWLDGCVAEVNGQDGCISCLTILRP